MLGGRKAGNLPESAKPLPHPKAHCELPLKQTTTQRDTATPSSHHYGKDKPKGMPMPLAEGGAGSVLLFVSFFCFASPALGWGGYNK